MQFYNPLYKYKIFDIYPSFLVELLAVKERVKPHMQTLAFSDEEFGVVKDEIDYFCQKFKLQKFISYNVPELLKKMGRKRYVFISKDQKYFSKR